MHMIDDINIVLQINKNIWNVKVTLKLSWDIYDMRPQHSNEGETRDFYSQNNKQWIRYNNETTALKRNRGNVFGQAAYKINLLNEFLQICTTLNCSLHLTS